MRLDEHGLPDNLPEELKADLLASCPDPLSASSGVGAYEIIDHYVPGDRLLLREGDSTFGRVHISQGGNNHELTNFAKDLWSFAWTLGQWIQINDDDPCWIKMSTPYTTPGGQDRTMCVFFDYKNVSVYGSKGVVTAYWKTGWVGTVGC